MQRDHDEWRRPWPSSPSAGDRPDDATGRVVTAPTPRPRPLAPPATWDVHDGGPGSPPGSVRPPDTVGTVDAPPRTSRGRGGIVMALVAGLLGAVIGTGGTLAVVGTDGDADTSTTAGQTSADGGDVRAPTIDLEGIDTDTVVPAVAEAVLPSVVRIDIVGGGAGGAEERLGLGSGVIYRSDGYVITNNHVVQDAPALDVKLTNGDEYEAEVVGTDPRNDLAVLRIDATGLPAINVRTDDPLVVGETAIAIGSPFGLDASVTAGVVSATGRDLTVPPRNGGQPTVIPAVIQTDAAINPGNSGGALVDREGRLIGINTAILSATGGSQGVGFAIPTDQAVTSADQLIETGEVQYPLLGVVGQDVTSEMAQRLGLEEGAGAVIREVQPGSGAAEAGLQADDVIVALDGDPIESMSDLVVAVRNRDPGDTVEVTYVRDGEQRTADVTLGELEDDS